jgi:hypothetical protein
MSLAIAIMLGRLSFKQIIAHGKNAGSAGVSVQKHLDELLDGRHIQFLERLGQ